MSATVVNDGSVASGTSVCVTFELFDGATSRLNRSVAVPSIKPGGRAEVDSSVTVLGGPPALWTIRSPKLYTLRTTVGLCTGGAPSDQVETAVGFRSLHYTADGGFFMNGEHVKV